MKKLIILGSTGSIGRSSLDVIAANPGSFKVTGLAANKSVDLLLKQIMQFKPEAVAVTDISSANEVSKKVGNLTKVHKGLDGLIRMTGETEADSVVNGLVGSVGLHPTIEALNTGKDVLLANKETMVMGGIIVMETAKKTGKNIIPIDSEMSAIYQCIKGEEKKHIKRLILTASGGPFVDKPAFEMETVTVEQALNHPTWGMGTKNTIDSATLMNKGLEVIEASMIFEIPQEMIDITIHRSSIVHSLVEFIDGSVLCQMSNPDMKLAIQYSMTDPERLSSVYGSLDFSKSFTLTFEPPDFDRFPCLGLAYNVLKKGGTAPAVLNGANEEAVKLFVDKKIQFTDIPKIISNALENHNFVSTPSLDEIISIDKDSKKYVQYLMKQNAF